MKVTDLIATLGALLGAVSSAFGGHIGWMIAFLMILWLVYRLMQCEKKHDAEAARRQRLALAVVYLAAGQTEEAKRRALELAGSDILDFGPSTNS